MASDSTSMLPGKSSLEHSQDVSHILQAAFHKHSLHDLESELVSNILAAKGSKDAVQESYVESLENVKSEYSRSIVNISHLEKHIMNAQTRLVSAREKNLLSQQVPTDIFESKVKSSLRDCLDPDLLSSCKLLSPKDFFQTVSMLSAPPKAADKPNYLKSLTRAEGNVEEARHVMIAWEEDGVELEDHIVYDESSVNNSARYEKMRARKTTTDKPPGSRPEEFWRDHVGVDKRNQEKTQLELLLKKTEGTKNPRHTKSSEGARTRSLMRPPNDKPSDPLSLPPIFIATPDAIQFTNYEPGKVYEAPIEIRNVSAVLRNCRVIPPKNGFFGINFGEFPSESSLIAPGMACIYRIKFLPDALCDYEDALSIHIPDRPSLTIPLLGNRPPPVLTLPSTIDVGECLISSTKVSTIKMKNTGGQGKFCILSKAVWPCASLKQAMGTTNPQRGIDVGNGFSVFPGTFRLMPNEEIPFQIIFNPSDLQSYSTEFVIICDNCNVRSFKLTGEGVRLQFDLTYIDGGVYTPFPSDFVDAFATSHIAFPHLNLGMAFDKKISVRNSRQMDVPFIWAIVKPHLVPPIPPLMLERDDTMDSVDSSKFGVKIPDCRIIEEQPTFTIEPHTGIMLAGQICDFVLSYLPDKLGETHSALHLIIPGVPQTLQENGSRDGSAKSEDGRATQTDTGKSQTPAVADVTALEIDIRGSCEPYSLSLNPCAIFMDGPTLIRTSSRHRFELRNDSRGPAAFEWQSITDDDAIVEVEPKIGLLEPGNTASLTLIVTGTKPGRVVKRVPCWVEFCPDAICIQLEATFKGPDCVFRDPTNKNQAMLAFLDFGLIRSTDVGEAQFLIVNTSAIDASWNLVFVPKLDSQKSLGEGQESDEYDCSLNPDEISVSVTNGTLAPFASQRVFVKLLEPFGSQLRKLGPRTGFLQMEIAHGKNRILQLFADIQHPEVCLLSSELLLSGTIFVETTSQESIFMLNKTNLSTGFSWQTSDVRYSENSVCNSCEFIIEPSSGIIGPKERLQLSLNVKPLKKGNLEAFITCFIPEVEQKLVLFVRGMATGLNVSYTVFESAMAMKMANTTVEEENEKDDVPDKKCVVDFNTFKLGEVVRRQLVIRNQTSIPTNFSLQVSKFAPTNDVLRAVQENDIRRWLMSSDAKTVAEIRSKLLSNGLGLAVVPIPSSGHLTAEGVVVVEVFTVADMWGEYRDNLISCVGDLDPDHIDIAAEAVGSPLLFQMMVAQRHKTACCRFGVAIQGTVPVTKKLRLLNEGPCDIRLDWRLYEVRKEETQFVDLIPYMLDPFPEQKPQSSHSSKGSNGQGVSRPEQVSRESLLSMLSSAGKELPPSTEKGEATGVAKTLEETDVVREQEEQQLISLVVRKHEGAPIEPNGLFSVSPNQVVIKGRSHATVEVTLDPRQASRLSNDEKFVNLEAFGLAFVSLTDPIRRAPDNSVKRVQWFDAEAVRLGITAQIQPAVLAMESMDDESLALFIPANFLVPKALYSDVERLIMSEATATGSFSGVTTNVSPVSNYERGVTEQLSTASSSAQQQRQPITLRFFNYHETDLRLTAEIASPFKIIYFGSANMNAFIERSVSKTPEVSLPAHDTLILKIDADSNMSMIEDLDSLVPNLAVVEGRFLTLSSDSLDRSVHYRRYLTIKYSNGASQNVRLSCSIPLPRTAVYTKTLAFAATLIGKSRELFFDVVNSTASDTWLRCHIETESDADRGCFRVRPSGYRIGPILGSGRRVAFSITFHPRHEGLHTATAVVIEKVMGQRFSVELTGSASYDEKYAI